MRYVSSILLKPLPHLKFITTSILLTSKRVVMFKKLLHRKSSSASSTTSSSSTSTKRSSSSSTINSSPSNHYLPPTSFSRINPSLTSSSTPKPSTLPPPYALVTPNHIPNVDVSTSQINAVIDSAQTSTDTTAPSNPDPAAEDPFDFLKSYDTVFLVDDSGSMAGTRWKEARLALMSVVETAAKYG